MLGNLLEGSLTFLIQLSGWGKIAVACSLVLAWVIADGFRRLEGASVLPRSREGCCSDEEWLMGPSQASRCVVGLPGNTIKCGASAAAVDVWDCTVPPPLHADGMSHLWGWLGQRLTAALLPDIAIRPDPVTILARPALVWTVLTDFERYSEWNPFHKKVELVELPPTEEGAGCSVAVRMTVAMGPVLGTIVSTETIYYADSERHILVYGIGRDGPACLRCVWLEPTTGPDGRPSTIFHSYDMIGGYPALFSRGHIVGVVHRGFTAQHTAMRERVHVLQAQEKQRRRAEKAKQFADTDRLTTKEYRRQQRLLRGGKTKGEAAADAKLSEKR